MRFTHLVGKPVRLLVGEYVVNGVLERKGEYFKVNDQFFQEEEVKKVQNRVILLKD